MSDDKKNAGNADAGIDEARRLLLLKAAYVPPAVIGALALSLEGCQVASCGPSACNPNCNPRTNCGPQTCPPNACNPNPCNPSLCGPQICNPAPPPVP